MRVAFIGAFVVLVLTALLRLPPMSDETYYWAWAQAPALSYLDHPPGIAWALFVSTSLLGDGLLGLRTVPAACMIATALLVTATVARRSPGRSWLALVTLAGAPMFTLGYLPATPDPLQGVAVALASHAGTRALEGDKRFAFLFTFTLVAGIAIKHTTALVMIGSVLFALGDARARRAVFSPASLFGALAGGLILIPWISSDASTTFQAVRVFAGERHRGLIAVPLMVGSMAGTLGPLTALVLLGLPFTRPAGACALEAGGSAALCAGCLVAVWLGTGEANWPMPAMVYALPAIIGVIARHETFLSRAFGHASKATALLMMIGLLHVAHPFLPIPIEKDRTLRDVGYDAVARVAEEVARRHAAPTLIARRYQVASELRYHLQDRLTVHELGTSRHSQYDLWPRPPLCAGDRAVLVMPRPGIPDELAAVPIAETSTVERGRAGVALDRYFITPVRIQPGRGCQ